ncbi:MAG: conjugal transfer protein TraG, partial [Muribaculaceae bacterium]|nr:conjugal transfer protein TraG [Muribaculaceae bacterium]
SINRSDVSHSFNTQMDSLIPPSKISTLTQGMFVGAVSDNFDERIEQKIFNAEIVVDTAKVKSEEAAYNAIPILTDFQDTTENKVIMKAIINANYKKVKQDVIAIVAKELERIRNTPSLKHLLPKG